MNLIKDLINKIIYGGTRSFSPAERKLLLAVVGELTSTEGDLLEKQINAICLVQRQNKGRLTMAYYRKSVSIEKFPYQEYAHCLAKVTYKCYGKRMKVSIVLHEGGLQSIEGNVPKALSEIEEILSVQIHPSGFKSAIDALDQEEHGTNAW
ncbi:hypothetical protein [Agarivorans aestuarii]|uniref:hypothetical protein n=1 Tax=Agarivorans aestuarii TaxID=1563703 RepID=UPI002E7746B2|nr:hypothetical protein [Agarivorans aestuarii]